MIKDTKTGRFKRVHKEWSLDTFDDGFVRTDGRFYVYFPKHHRADVMGYTFRSIAAYEAYHNDIVTKEYCIHHKDGNKLNDSEENLIKMNFGEHTVFHCKKEDVKCICIVCGKTFYLPQWRINEGRGKFCTHSCGMKEHWRLWRIKNNKEVKII